MVYRVREKSWGPTYLRAGLGFEATGEGNNSLAVAGSVNRTRINPLGAEWKTELELGSGAIASTRFYQPLSFTRGWFVEPFFSYRRRNVPVFDGGERVAELDVRAEDIRTDLGYEFGRYGEVRLGLRRSWITPRLESGVLPEDTQVALGETYDLAGLSLLGAVDRLDSATLPKQGFLVLLSALQSLE